MLGIPLNTQEGLFIVLLRISLHYLTYCMYVFDSWASSDDVWIKMLNKELKYIHDKTFMEQHPSLQPKMRAILLDWLIEVCD